MKVFRKIETMCRTVYLCRLFNLQKMGDEVSVSVNVFTILSSDISKERARPGFEPGTSSTRSKNHTPRPTSILKIVKKILLLTFVFRMHKRIYV